MGITFSARESIAFVELDRPEKHNAVDSAMKRELASIWRRIAADPEIRAVVLSGAGDAAFSAGSDLDEIRAVGPVTTDVLAAALPGLVEPLETPVVAALQGWVLGFGLSLAIHADIRVAAADARFGFPEVVHGSVSAISASVLGELVPRGAALDLLLTGEQIDATRAYEIGLVQRVVAPGTALAAATEIATTLASRDPLAVRVTKGLAVAGTRERTLQALGRIDGARRTLHPKNTNRAAEEVNA